LIDHAPQICEQASELVYQLLKRHNILGSLVV
jgi:hypothetical protein